MSDNVVSFRKPANDDGLPPCTALPFTVWVDDQGDIVEAEFDGVNDGPLHDLGRKLHSLAWLVANRYGDADTDGNVDQVVFSAFFLNRGDINHCGMGTIETEEQIQWLERQFARLTADLRQRLSSEEPAASGKT